MKCPCCGIEMTVGVVQSAREIFFTTEARQVWFRPRKNDVLLSVDNWTKPSCTAYHCLKCKKVVIDYLPNT